MIIEKSLQLLLISNSFQPGLGLLEHAREEVKDFLQGVSSVVFIPYAQFDMDKATELSVNFLNSLGIKLESIHLSQDTQKTIENAEAFLVAGGNTFRLLDRLYQNNILEILRSKILTGTPYLAASAGINIVAPTIKTTNDMPIIQPTSFDALNVLPFQINPHFVDSDPNSTYMGENREERLHEFHQENDTLVVGLREGAWLGVQNGQIKIGGQNGAALFEKGKAKQEVRNNLL